VNPPGPDQPAPWAEAAQAAALLAIDPVGLGGAVLRAMPGPVRDAWLALLRGMLPPATPWRRVPLAVGDSRLLGGLDLTATLQAGRPVAERGLLAEADGGVLLLAMAERVTANTAAHLAAALDTGEAVAERDGLALRAPARLAVVALDEGLAPDEVPPAALTSVRDVFLPAAATRAATRQPSIQSRWAGRGHGAAKQAAARTRCPRSIAATNSRHCTRHSMLAECRRNAAQSTAVSPGSPASAALQSRSCRRSSTECRTMTYAPECVIHHAHVMGLAGFWRQHLAYGRGAYRFHAAHRRRKPDHRIVQWTYYRTLLASLLPPRGAHATPALVFALGVSQVANLLGFFLEPSAPRPEFRDG
jgi:hypothetical protein